MGRITDRDIKGVVNRINRITGSPMDYHDENGIIAIGHYGIDGAYGGVSLHRIVNTSGGCRDVFSSGHMPKRALYDLMHAWLKGFDAANGGPL